MAGRRHRADAGRPAGPTDPVVPTDPGAGADAGRRTLLRGAAAVGLAGVTGIGLSGCGGEGSDRTVASTAPDPVPAPGPAEAGSGPGGAPSKSQLYRRTPEPRAPRRADPPARKERAAAARKSADADGSAARTEQDGPVRAADRAPAAVETGGEGAPSGKGSPDLRAAQRAGDRPDTDGPRQRRGKGSPASAAPETAEPAATSAPTRTPTRPVPGELAKTSDIPVGGGKVFATEKIVVTQPTSGTFKGFSAVCTHEQCLVGDVSGGTINCPCHGSKFGVADGAVTAGPAAAPLPAAKITVSGGSIRRG